MRYNILNMKNSQKGSVLVWVVVVLVIIIGTGVYFYSRNAATTTSQKITVTHSDWKTYDKFGVSFSYPSTWFVVDQDTVSLNLYIQSPERHKYFVAHPDGSAHIAEISIQRLAKSDTYPYPPADQNISSTKFNGYDAKSYSYEGDGPFMKGVIIEKGNYKYVIETESPSSTTTTEIVSTFKLTN